MRCDELIQLETTDVNLIHDTDTRQPMFLVKIRPETTKTNVSGSFTISRDTRSDYFSVVSKYRNLRPNNAKTSRFFLNYQNNRCTCQPIGIHKISKMCVGVAEFLNLDNANRYTGTVFSFSISRTEERYFMCTNFLLLIIGHSLRRTSATKAADNGASVLTLKRLGRWQSEKVAAGYVEDSTHSKKKTEKILHLRKL